MKTMAAQADFCLYLNAFLSLELFGAWQLAHVYPIKVLITYRMDKGEQPLVTKASKRESFVLHNQVLE